MYRINESLHGVNMNWVKSCICSLTLFRPRLRRSAKIIAKTIREATKAAAPKVPPTVAPILIESKICP